MEEEHPSEPEASGARGPALRPRHGLQSTRGSRSAWVALLSDASSSPRERVRKRGVGKKSPFYFGNKSEGVRE